MQILGVVAMVEALPTAEPEPTSADEPQATPEPTREHAPEPQAAPPSATPTPSADCTQWHTINANETRLSQITDWYGLDLAEVAALNGLDANAPLTAGSQICLSGSGQVQPQEPEPGVLQPVGPWYAGSGAPADPACPLCPNLPDHPELAVKSVPNVPVIYNPPGSYSRDLPGLDYEWELVFTDDSTLWNWRVRDFQGCYDGLRVHMGDVPKEFGLARLEVRLSDPWLGADTTHYLQEMEVLLLKHHTGR